MRKRDAASAAATKISGRDNVCIELVCLALTLALFFLAARIGSML
jgi:hypothetical protein